MSISIGLPGLKPSDRERGFRPWWRLGPEGSCWHGDSTRLAPPLGQGSPFPKRASSPLRVCPQLQAVTAETETMRPESWESPESRRCGRAQAGAHFRRHTLSLRIGRRGSILRFPREKQRAWTLTARCVLILFL